MWPLRKEARGLLCASSTIDPTQETAENNNEADGASGKTFLRKGKVLHGSMSTEGKK